MRDFDTEKELNDEKIAEIMKSYKRTLNSKILREVMGREEEVITMDEFKKFWIELKKIKGFCGAMEDILKAIDEVEKDNTAHMALDDLMTAVESLCELFY